MFAVMRSRAAWSRRVTLSRCAAISTCLLGASFPAHAVVVRGTITDTLGVPVSAARIQLIQGQGTSAFAISNADGTFEIRSGDSGRFLLLSSAASFAPNIGKDFYGGRADVVIRNVVLSPAEITTQVSVTATGIPTPLPQLTAPVSLVSQDDLATRIGVVDELRQSPGVFAVQQGQTGSLTSLFVRGGNSDSNKVLIDGIPAEDVGGRFDFGTVSSTGLAGLETYRGPNSALYGSDSLASVVNLSTPRGSTLKPVLNYSGDAGNLHTWRNEASLSGTYRKADYYTTYSRFDTSNALQLDRFHSSTAAANLGYNFSANTSLRFTLRNADSAAGVPNAYDFYGISANAKQADQNLYSGATLENRTSFNWHNLVRYGIARKREQFTTFSPAGSLLNGTYYGNIVTIRGANGTQATGRAAIAYAGTFPARYDQASNRDELYYQSDYAFSRHLVGLFGFRYENERGLYTYPIFGTDQRLNRTNYNYNLEFQGDIRNRIFYSLGGAVQKNQVFGTRGTPRLGIAWVPIRPSSGLFHGTKLRFNFARGVQEPNLAIQFASLFGALTTAGNTSAIAQYSVTPINAQESRNYDGGIDQNIVGQKLILKAGYFHNQFDHQFEYVSSSALRRYFGIPSPIPNLFGAYLNSLTFGAQGAEAEIQYQALSRLMIRGGYTYLDAVVQRSFSSDALRVYGSTTNRLYPGITIGSSSPLAGARPFRRPPHSGFFAVQYTGTKWSAALKGAMASRSDDSTFLGGSTPSFDNSLLLPNRNLDFGYAKLDAYGTYSATHNLTVFADLENLLNNQHIGPIGYPGLPFTFRTGLKLRLGGD